MVKSVRRSPKKTSRKTSKKVCPYGYFLRKGYSYTKKSGVSVKVKSTCISEKGRKGPARGGPKKSRVVKITHPGSLKKYGYHLKESSSKRDEALVKILKAYGYSETIKKLNAIAVLFKTSEPGYSRKLKRDMTFVGELAGRKKYSRKRSAPKSPKKAAKATRKITKKISKKIRKVSKNKKASRKPSKK